MRLIDADILIEKLKSYAEWDWNKSLCTMLANVVDDCIEFVEEQPTAYSVAKVVGELEELKMRYFLTIANTGDEKSDFAYENVGNALDKAIEIVKQGGVSDDVCEWRLCDEEANVYDTSCRNPHILIEGTPKGNNYEYCPYCGKKIKIVGD